MDFYPRNFQKIPVFFAKFPVFVICWDFIAWGYLDKKPSLVVKSNFMSHFTLILKHTCFYNNNFFLNLSRMPYSSWNQLSSEPIFSRTRLEQNCRRRWSCSKQLEFHCQFDWLWLAFLWRFNHQWKLGRNGCALCRRLDYWAKIKSWNSFTVWPWSKRTGKLTFDIRLSDTKLIENTVYTHNSVIFVKPKKVSLFELVSLFEWLSLFWCMFIAFPFLSHPPRFS